MEDKIQLFQEWYAEQVVRWHTENTPKEIIAKECFLFGVQAAQPSVQADGAWTCPKCNALYGGELPDNCIECGTPRR